MPYGIKDLFQHWPQFYQTRSAWSMDQGSTKKRSAVHNFVPTVTKFCVMWEGLSLPQDTKFGNCRDEIVDRRVIFIWSLIHGSSWSGLIKVQLSACCLMAPCQYHIPWGPFVNWTIRNKLCLKFQSKYAHLLLLKKSCVHDGCHFVQAST